MIYKDYYRGLGVAHDASADEIRSAYHKLALQYHPDHNPDDPHAEEKFKEINEAYQVLSEPKKRARYDKISASYEAENKPRSGTDGFADFVNTVYTGPIPSSKATARRRRAAPRQNHKKRPDMQLREFVIQELVSMHTVNSITYTLCENYGVTWQDAKTLINDIRIQKAKLIRRRQAPWMLPAAFSMLIGGVGSTILGAYFIVFVATFPLRSGSLVLLMVPQVPYFLLQIPAVLGYAWLSVGTGIGLTIASLRSIQDAWAALSEPAEQYS